MTAAAAPAAGRAPRRLRNLPGLAFSLAYGLAWRRVRAASLALFAAADSAVRARQTARLARAYRWLAWLHPHARPLLFPGFPVMASDFAASAALAARAAASLRGVPFADPGTDPAAGLAWRRLAEADDYIGRWSALSRLAVLLEPAYGYYGVCTLRTLASAEFHLDQVSSGAR